MSRTRLLFICWGNICRSPTAEAIMARTVSDAGLADSIEVDSAGVSSEHAGDTPDSRSTAEASKRGLDLSSQRARQVTGEDWERFDLLLVADDIVERRLRRQAPPGADPAKVVRITDFLADGRKGTDVPDPYYGGRDGFRDVFDLLQEACDGLLAHLSEPVDEASPSPAAS
jgi:protein-tyrosine phosphatase